MKKSERLLAYWIRIPRRWRLAALTAFLLTVWTIEGVRFLTSRALHLPTIQDVIICLIPAILLFIVWKTKSPKSPPN
ncbi:hypothetical protein ADM98_10600 [Exiguobacterium sp. BMC-KP]|uniref:hypothetical protein n=1 Tax=Exiguobacterium sp. BMC-KP TaxID=1684312 RepID=UPI0006AA3D85|nr:hypothetical protein [Exiguobacterium sp. BMC-KP]KOP29325.1 hypothetical protein ADM98_10600 [Exiguobacterium sp. BMC-KP]